MVSTELRVGEALRRIRRDHRFSLRHVAEQAGISVATLSRVETNKQSVDVALLLALAEVLHVSAGELLDGHGKGDGDGRAQEAKLPPRSLDDRVDVLLNTIDLLRDELVDIQRTVTRRKKR